MCEVITTKINRSHQSKYRYENELPTTAIIFDAVRVVTTEVLSKIYVKTLPGVNTIVREHRII